MDYSRIFGLNLVRKIDLHRLGALAVLTLGAFSVWCALAPNDRAQIALDYSSSFLSAAAGSELPEASSGGSDSARSIYPYSVIPGGVENAAELRNSITRDPVVAQHYQGFNVARGRVVRLNQDRFLYVSYRLANRVFWTKKRLTLLKGETVITDGEHMARTRCGNRVAEAPAGPVLAAEPELEAAPPGAAQALAGAPALASAPFAPGEVPLMPPPTSGSLIPPGSGSPGGGINTPGLPIAGGGPPSTGVTPPPGTQ